MFSADGVKTIEILLSPLVFDKRTVGPIMFASWI
jgi:hypothetical protein